MWTHSGNWCSTSSSLTRHILAVYGDCCNAPLCFGLANTQMFLGCLRLRTPVGLSHPLQQGLRVKLKMILGKLPQKGHRCCVTALQGYFFWPYCFLMPPMILLQRVELWELRAGLGANRAWRVWRFRHGQVRWCVERHAKTPRYDSLHVGRGR